MLDFAIQETALYLDSYPDSEAALEYYHSIKELRDDVLSEYESKYGPMTIFGNENMKTWQWAEAPWPWEAEAN